MSLLSEYCSIPFPLLGVKVRKVRILRGKFFNWCLKFHAAQGGWDGFKLSIPPAENCSHIKVCISETDTGPSFLAACVHGLTHRTPRLLQHARFPRHHSTCISLKVPQFIQSSFIEVHQLQLLNNQLLVKNNNNKKAKNIPCHEGNTEKQKWDSYYYCDLCLDIVVSRWTLQGKTIQDTQNQVRLNTTNRTDKLLYF